MGAERAAHFTGGHDYVHENHKRFVKFKIAAVHFWWNDHCGDLMLRIIFFILLHSAEI